MYVKIKWIIVFNWVITRHWFYVNSDVFSRKVLEFLIGKNYREDGNHANFCRSRCAVFVNITGYTHIDVPQHHQSSVFFSLSSPWMLERYDDAFRNRIQYASFLIYPLLMVKIFLMTLPKTWAVRIESSEISIKLAHLFCYSTFVIKMTELNACKDREEFLPKNILRLNSSEIFFFFS